VPSNAADTLDSETLRALLADIEGVEHVLIDSGLGEICLLVRADVSATDTLGLALPLASGHALHVAYAPERQEHRRLRFVSLHRSVLPDQQLEYRVTLEWAGNEHTFAATGEKGESLELRTVAAATLGAISALVPQQLGIRLAGVKQVRAFDADLLVVSLYRPDAQPHNLVGAVVASDDSRRAAANAVLNALNRLLGNYLVRP
jgi:hypothetical protein